MSYSELIQQRAPASPPKVSERKPYTFVVTLLAALLVGLVLAQMYVSRQKKPQLVAAGPIPEAALADHDAARQAVTAAKSAWETAQRSFQSQRQQANEKLQRSLTALQALVPPPAAEPLAAGEKNPKWLAVAAELKAITDRKQKLAPLLTPAHPEAISLDEKIAALQQQLGGIPEYLNPTPQATSADQTTALAQWRGAIRDLQAQQRTAEQQLNAAFAGIAAAEITWQSALENERKCWEICLRATAEKKLVDAGNLEHTEQQASMRLFAFALSGVMALAFASSITIASGGRKNRSSMVPAPHFQVVPQFATVGRSLSELTLAAALIAFTGAAILNQSFLADFVHDPAGCFAHVVETAMKSLPV